MELHITSLLLNEIKIVYSEIFKGNDFRRDETVLSSSGKGNDKSQKPLGKNFKFSSTHHHLIYTNVCSNIQKAHTSYQIILICLIVSSDCDRQDIHLFPCPSHHSRTISCFLVLFLLFPSCFSFYLNFNLHMFITHGTLLMCSYKCMLSAWVGFLSWIKH